MNEVKTAISNDDCNTQFKLGDRVRFANGPCMYVVSIEEDSVYCYWWVGPELHEASFPAELLIHVQTVPVIETFCSHKEVPGEADDS